MKHILVLILCLYGLGVKAQLLFDRVNLAEVRKFEAQQGSHSLGFAKQQVGADFFYGAKENVDYYPLVFDRTNDKFDPKCNVEYYYSTKDSVVNAIVYDWNIMNVVKNLKKDGDKIEKQLGRKAEYLSQYNDIRSQLIAKYGEPSSTENIDENSDPLFVKTEWHLPNQDLILTFMFSTKLKAIGPFKIGSFRVRLVADWNP